MMINLSECKQTGDSKPYPHKKRLLKLCTMCRLSSPIVVIPLSRISLFAEESRQPFFGSSNEMIEIMTLPQLNPGL
jgi:hypothetical protein